MTSHRDGAAAATPFQEQRDLVSLASKRSLSMSSMGKEWLPSTTFVRSRCAMTGRDRFEHLVVPEIDVVLRVARPRIRNGAEVEDLVQGSLWHCAPRSSSSSGLVAASATPAAPRPAPRAESAVRCGALARRVAPGGDGDRVATVAPCARHDPTVHDPSAG